VILTNERNEHMTSARKAEANRRNALKSTGPKTPAGKAAVRHNSLRHGLLSKDILLPGEDEEALRELAEGLRAELQPVGELETRLVGRITSLLWRLRRLERVEAGIFAWELYGELAERAEREARAQEKSPLHDLIAADTTVVDGRKHREALEKAEEMRVKRDAETATLGRTFVRDADKTNAFSKLSRYETSMERGLYRALHELQRLQAARTAAGSVSPPLAVDVDVSGIPEGDR
jgi:hypothetical protein